MTGADLIARLKKHPLSVGCGLVCLVCVALYFVRGNAAEAMARESEERAAEAAKILANVRNSANLSEHAAALGKLAGEIDGRLMRASQLAINLQYFYKLEAETGVKLVDVRPTGGIIQPPKTGSYVGIPFTVAVQGNYHQTLSFLRRLEAGPYFTRFNSVAYSKVNGSNSGFDVLNLSLNMEVLGAP